MDSHARGFGRSYRLGAVSGPSVSVPPVVGVCVRVGDAVSLFFHEGLTSVGKVVGRFVFGRVVTRLGLVSDVAFSRLGRFA